MGNLSLTPSLSLAPPDNSKLNLDSELHGILLCLPSIHAHKCISLPVEFLNLCISWTTTFDIHCDDSNPHPLALGILLISFSYFRYRPNPSERSPHIQFLLMDVAGTLWRTTRWSKGSFTCRERVNRRGSFILGRRGAVKDVNDWIEWGRSGALNSQVGFIRNSFTYAEFIVLSPFALSLTATQTSSSY